MVQVGGTSRCWESPFGFCVHYTLHLMLVFYKNQWVRPLIASCWYENATYSLVPRPEENQPGNEAKDNYTCLECNLILLVHWLQVCQECSYNQETNIHSVMHSTNAIHYKELITNVAYSSSGFILNFDIPSYVEVSDSHKWNSIGGTFRWHHWLPSSPLM